MMNENIPIYEAYIDDEQDGIFRISLVDSPAVDSMFVAFSKEEKKNIFKCAIQDEEKRIVFGVILRADYPIYRINRNGGCYVVWSKETIQQIAEKMLIDSTYNNINIEHIEDSDIEGVNLMQIFIKDTEKGVNPKGFEDIEDGSLFGVYKVNNEAVWEAIKEGKFKGFSLEGLFSIAPKEDEILELAKMLNKIKNVN